MSSDPIISTFAPPKPARLDPDLPNWMRDDDCSRGVLRAVARHLAPRHRGEPLLSLIAAALAALTAALLIPMPAGAIGYFVLIGYGGTLEGLRLRLLRQQGWLRDLRVTGYPIERVAALTESRTLSTTAWGAAGWIIGGSVAAIVIHGLAMGCFASAVIAVWAMFTHWSILRWSMHCTTRHGLGMFRFSDLLRVLEFMLTGMVYLLGFFSLCFVTFVLTCTFGYGIAKASGTLGHYDVTDAVRISQTFIAAEALVIILYVPRAHLQSHDVRISLRSLVQRAEWLTEDAE